MKVESCVIMIPYSGKPSWISRFCGHSRKFSPWNLEAWQKLAIHESFSAKIVFFTKFAKVFSLESFPLYGSSGKRGEREKRERWCAPACVKRLHTAREHTESPLTVLDVPLHLQLRLWGRGQRNIATGRRLFWHSGNSAKLKVTVSSNVASLASQTHCCKKGRSLDNHVYKPCLTKLYSVVQSHYSIFSHDTLYHCLSSKSSLEDDGGGPEHLLRYCRCL